MIFFSISHGFLESVISTIIFYPAVLSWNGTWWVYIAETYPTRARGTADSWQTGLNDFAWIVGSAIYGFVLDALGFTLTYIVLGAIPVLLGAIIIAAMGKGVPPTAELEEIAY